MADPFPTRTGTSGSPRTAKAAGVSSSSSRCSITPARWIEELENSRRPLHRHHLAAFRVPLPEPMEAGSRKSTGRVATNTRIRVPATIVEAPGSAEAISALRERQDAALETHRHSACLDRDRPHRTCAHRAVHHERSDVDTAREFALLQTAPSARDRLPPAVMQANGVERIL